jgi:vacuolar-type H+-ATPase subunit C/Vma6
VDESQRSGSLLDIELALDRAYAQYGLRVAGGEGTLRRWLGTEITATNLKTALKLRRVRDLTREDRQRFFILGGSLSQERFLALADPQTSIAEASSVPLFGPHLGGTEDLLVMERAIDRILLRTAAQMFLHDPLALDIVIGYLARKAAEVSNIRVIAHARQLGVPADVARQEIVSV